MNKEPIYCGHTCECKSEEECQFLKPNMDEPKVKTSEEQAKDIILNHSLHCYIDADGVERVIFSMSAAIELIEDLIWQKRRAKIMLRAENIYNNNLAARLAGLIIKKEQLETKNKKFISYFEKIKFFLENNNATIGFKAIYDITIKAINKNQHGN